MGLIILGGFLFLLCAGTAVGMLRQDWDLFNIGTEFRLGFREFENNYWIENEQYTCQKDRLRYDIWDPIKMCYYIGMKTPIDYARYRIWLRKGHRDAEKREQEKKLSIYRARVEFKRKEREEYWR